jgi:RNA polymerase sigma-70 factor (ECF subfamily)
MTAEATDPPSRRARPKIDRLDPIEEAATTAWPTLRIDRAALRAHVAALTPPPQLEHAADVALAFACAQRSEDAIRALDPTLRAAVDAAVRKLAPPAGFADDVAQRLREVLLLTQPARIGTFGGRAPLRTWLRMAALRTALNLRRRRDDDARARAMLTTSCATTATGTDLTYLRARYKDEFGAALKDAVSHLSTKDRRLLRAYVVERATLEALAASKGVGVATVWRWLRAIRERLTHDTKAFLCGALKITDSDYEGIAALVRSDLDVSLGALLRS